MAILLAVGSEGQPVPDVPDVPDVAADEAAKAAALAETVAAQEAASIEHFLTSRTETIKFGNCNRANVSECTSDVFILSPGRASGGLSGACHFDALVSEAIVMPDGTKVFAHLANLVVAPRRKDKLPKSIHNIMREHEAVAVRAAMIFDTPGFHRICFDPFVQELEFSYQFYRLPAQDGEGAPDEVFEGKSRNAGKLIGGLAGIARLDSEPRMPRLAFFQSPYRSFSETVGCTITGCPDKLAISLTVRGDGERLPIFQGTTPTPYKTDKTIMVPRDQVGSLFVKYPDGTQQQVKTCRKLQETRISTSFYCQKAK